MRIGGTPDAFNEDFLTAAGFIADLLDLTLAAWQRVSVNGEHLEPRLSALLKNCLNECIYESERDGSGLPFRVQAEVQGHDPTTGRQLFRTDIEIRRFGWPLVTKDDKPWFTWEAKCLRVPQPSGSPRAGNSEYIEEMVSFLNDAKQIKPSFCGMLGYVLDRDVSAAHNSLQTSIGRSAAKLQMSTPARMEPHDSRPNPPYGRTDHTHSVGRGRLSIYHLLLAA